MQNDLWQIQKDSRKNNGIREREVYWTFKRVIQIAVTLKWLFALFAMYEYNHCLFYHILKSCEKSNHAYSVVFLKVVPAIVHFICPPVSCKTPQVRTVKIW